MISPRSCSACVTLVAAAVLTLTVGAGGQKGGRSSDTPVTSTLDDSGEIALSTNHRIQSEGYGSYAHGSDSVKSVLQTSNQCCQDWELGTGASTTRSILVDFRDPVEPNLGDTAPFPLDFVHGRLIAKCHVVSSSSFPGMTLGESLNCPLLVTFPDTLKTYWRVALNPIAYPDTDFAQVSCVGVDSTGKCNEWTIVSGVTQPGGAVKNIGRLEKVTSKGNTPPENHGNFYLTFSIRVTNP